MGTNYYVTDPPCEHCGRHDDPLHIGKSSYGWCFSLHVIPERGLNTLEDWQEFWHDRYIFDEYDEVITPDEMTAIIMERGPEFGDRYGKSLERHDPYQGFVGRGDGPYDLIEGDFS